MQRLLVVVLLAVATSIATAYDQKDLNEEIVIAAHWQQLSGEFDAYLYQTFNGAREQLKEALRKTPEGKKPAIITDIDDTLINGNIYFSSLVGTQDQRSIERSRYWWNNQPAEALAGTVEFFQDASDMGIEVFYISGRFDDVKPATMKSLRKLGFPVIDDSYILLQAPNNKTLSKEQKRQSIRDRGYHVLMIMGDQLDDLAEVPAKLHKDKKKWVSDQQDLFSKYWFILPNPVYGAWEESVADGYRTMTPEQKHQARIKALSYKTKYTHPSDPVYSQHMLQADVWLQVSADYHATVFQAFNQAESALRKQQSTSIEKPAIVVDIDGTILEFIPILTGPMHKESPENNHLLIWYLNEMENAKPIPGAKEFLNYAKSEGYDIFYITARSASTLRPGAGRDIEEATIKQLQRYGFPQADHEHTIFRDEYCPNNQIRCGKEVHRAAVTSGKVNGNKYQVVMYVGDYLTDFDLIEQGLKPLGRESVKSARSLFGKQYIIIPNPINTSWQRVTYSEAAGRNYHTLTQQQQAELRRSMIRDWQK